MLKVIVLGGGAAGFFATLAAKERLPSVEAVLMEKSAKLLSKVRISGGGRCNVTHACFDPLQLAQNYPRGSKELLSPFHSFQPQDTIHWFSSRGVELKTEKDGRIFPISDCSGTIIDCLMKEADLLKVEIRTLERVSRIEKIENSFLLFSAEEDPIRCDRLILATGSSPEGYAFATSLGHTIEPPVPSLFTFNVPSFPLADLAGISVENVEVHILNRPHRERGPLLITHWGFSGPAPLKLSAWEARFLNQQQYTVTLQVDWLPHLTLAELRKKFRELNREKLIALSKELSLPKNLWKRLLNHLGIDSESRISTLGNGTLLKLSEKLKSDLYAVSGKTTHKEEFVTCGGVTLSEVDFRTMESKRCKGLFFAGEILDIDGITGGFNFQSAWTTGWIAGRASAIL